MEKSRKQKESFFSKYGCYLLGFFIPLAIMIVLYMLKNIYPFGDEMYLRSDCYHQYAPFMQEFYNKLHNGGSLLYSWEIGTGSNFTALYAYYLASPLNWLVYFAPKGHITEVISLFILLKTALCGLTFTIYISNHHKTKNVSMAAFAIFYALSSYMAAYSWNIMWLDLMVLLPIVILGLENLVLKGKCMLYIISLGICIFSNYYIAIMICIYCVIYFFVLLYVHRRRYSGHFTIVSMFKFFYSSILAGGLGMAMVLPEYYSLLTTASSDLEVPTSVMNYFSMLEMVSRSLICVECSIFDPHNPNLYCTVLVFLLIPIYCISRKVNYKEKIAKIAVVLFFLLSFNTNVLNFVWHGFHYPNSLPARQSFIYIFLVLTMCYEGWTYVGEVNKKQLFAILAGVFFLFIMLEQMFVGDDYPFYIVYASFGFILVYTIIFRTYKKNLRNNGWVVYLFFIICIAESAINMDVTGLGTTSRSAYLEDNHNITSLLDHVKEKENDKFYRTEKVIHRTKNDAAWNNYKGVSVFSSSASGGLTQFYKRMGFENSFNAYSFYGYTPLTASILDVKYMLSDRDVLPNSSFELYSQIEDELYVFKNKHALPLGFMVGEKFIDNFDINMDNPFYVQNEFVSAATDTEEIFHVLHSNTTSQGVARTRVDESCYVYIYLNNRTMERATVNTYDAEGTLIDTLNFTLDKKPRICNLGYIPADGAIEISNPDTEEKVSMNALVYSFNPEAYEEAYKQMASQGMEVTSFKDTRIEGKIDVKTKGLMFTSIPYDKGWTVLVDGKKIKPISIKDGFLGVYLDEGSHKLEFRYYPRGLKAGLLVTVSTILLLLVYSLYRVLHDDRKSGKGKHSPDDNKPVRRKPRISEDNEVSDDDIKYEYSEENMNKDDSEDEGILKNHVKSNGKKNSRRVSLKDIATKEFAGEDESEKVIESEETKNFENIKEDNSKESLSDGSKKVDMDEFAKMEFEMSNEMEDIVIEVNKKDKK